jgi:hypothetical protein
MTLKTGFAIMTLTTGLPAAARDPVPQELIVIDLTGKAAPPFALRDIDGRIHRLETYRGNWLLLVFHRHLG